jgi:MoaA/NifB/PqqE/SkfB family radical SAM enzyme
VAIEPIESIRKIPNSTVVTWHLGNKCNFECSYCPAFLHNGSYGWPSVENMKTTIEALHEHYHLKLKRQLFLSFSGGEPTLFPKFIEMSTWIKSLNKKIQVQVVSNGSRTIRYWNDLLPHIDNAIISYHNEFIQYDHFVKVMELLYRKLLRIHFNMQPENWNECVDKYTRLKAMGLPVFAKPLFIGFKEELYPYTPEQLDFIHKNTTSSIVAMVRRAGVENREPVQDLILQNENHYLGWDCMAGVENLVVKANGNIVRGECAIAKVGNVNKANEGFQFPDTSIVCTKKTCSCIVDIMLTKQRPKDVVAEAV